MAAEGGEDPGTHRYNTHADWSEDIAVLTLFVIGQNCLPCKMAACTVIFVASSVIGLITVSDAILTGRQSGQKLQCLYGNPMAKNFFQNRILRNL